MPFLLLDAAVRWEIYPSEGVAVSFGQGQDYLMHPSLELEGGTLGVGGGRHVGGGEAVAAAAADSLYIW